MCSTKMETDEHFNTPEVLELEVTTLCNAKCIFCPRHLFDYPEYIRMNTFQKVLERVVESPVSRLKFVGMGEPTLHQDILIMLKKVRATGIAPVLNTNGSKLHRVGIKEVLELVDEVIVSCHSLQPEVHSKIFGCGFFDQVLSNLETLILENESYGRTITLYVVVTNLNKNCLKDFERFAGKVRIITSGCTNRTLGSFSKDLINFDACENMNHYTTISESDPMCGYALSTIMIDHNGNYLLCTNDSKREQVIGTVWNYSINEATDLIKTSLREGRFVKSVCAQCDNFEPYRANLRGTPI